MVTTCLPIGDTPPPPTHTHTPLNGDHSGMSTRTKFATSPVKGSICLASPDLGGDWGGGVYISEHLWNTPLASRPQNGDQFCILIRGGPLMDCCHPATFQMMKIRRLGIELLMVRAIRTSGHTRRRVQWKRQYSTVVTVKKGRCSWREKKLALKG